MLYYVGFKVIKFCITSGPCQIRDLDADTMGIQGPETSECWLALEVYSDARLLLTRQEIVN